METVVMWVFLALIQGEGIMGVTAGSLTSCQEEYAKAHAAPNVIALSDCQEVTLTKIGARQ
jgi:hypothetical protein